MRAGPEAVSCPCQLWPVCSKHTHTVHLPFSMYIPPPPPHHPISLHMHHLMVHWTVIPSGILAHSWPPQSSWCLHYTYHMLLLISKQTNKQTKKSPRGNCLLVLQPSHVTNTGTYSSTSWELGLLHTAPTETPYCFPLSAYMYCTCL